MTFVFAPGVATVILPLLMGVALVRQLVLGGHMLIYLAGGILMLGLAQRNRMLFASGLFVDSEAFSRGRPSERKLRRAIEARLLKRQDWLG